MNENKVSLDEICAELEGISFEISAISCLFSEDADKIDRPTDKCILETLFAIARHISRCVNDIDTFNNGLSRKEH